ncbi:class I SAM-dependent methyltransferase [uncultured Lamprocystis sp.]|uniref:class I SAM-dependent methyltransferase n=1 Tax=uncultured Lamprocystis sp. TaxID=543132 RepID=UPI0025F22145|nr:class I SAM-dependent methyltransferase [uncultured Lamprocystis sp.]
MSDQLHVPPGHIYSPIPSAADVARALRRAGHYGRTLTGIELRTSEQLKLLDLLLPFYNDLPFAAEPGRHRFYYNNTWFTYADAVFYALMLRYLRPRRVIEVGSGYSSALALDVDGLFLGGTTHFTFIDPDPLRLLELATEADLRGRIVTAPVQDVPLSLFAELGKGDILFVDSSHVIKAGSDVQHLLDEVFPRLVDGVYIHIHDVFYPFEYPESWLVTGCSVNEAYAVRALLQFSSGYRIELFTDYLKTTHREWLSERMPLTLNGSFPTGGIWLRRTAAST